MDTTVPPGSVHTPVAPDVTIVPVRVNCVIRQVSVSAPAKVTTGESVFSVTEAVAVEVQPFKPVTVSE